MNKTKTAIYCRMASADDERLSWQKEALLKYADCNGYTDCVCYGDNGFNGLSLDRPGMQSLISDIQNGLVGTVIVANLSRIARDYPVMAEWLNILKEYGVTLVSVNDAFRFPDNDFLFGLYEKLSLLKGGQTLAV